MGDATHVYCILISNEFNNNYSTRPPDDVVVARARQRTITYGFRCTSMWDEKKEF